MVYNFIWLFSVLFYNNFCNGEVTTVIDIKESSGFGSSSSPYYSDASDLPRSLPSAIVDSGSKGIWYFTALNHGGILLIRPETTVSNLMLKYYSSKSILYFQDHSVPDSPEIRVPIPETGEDGWTSYNFEFTRDVVSTDSIALRIQFPAPETTKPQLFLLDTITIAGEFAPTTTTVSTTESAVTSIIDLQEDAGFSLSTGPYYLAASDLPPNLPLPIRTSDSEGIWYFTEESQGGIIMLTPETTVQTTSFKCYSAQRSILYFKDQSDPNQPEVRVSVPATGKNIWTNYEVEFARVGISTEPIIIRIQFPPSNDRNEPNYFLIDKIEITGVTATSAVPTTTETSTSTTETSTTDTSTSTTNIPTTDKQTTDTPTEAQTNPGTSTTDTTIISSSTENRALIIVPTFVIFASIAALLTFI